MTENRTVEEALSFLQSGDEALPPDNFDDVCDESFVEAPASGVPTVRDFRLAGFQEAADLEPRWIFQRRTRRRGGAEAAGQRGRI